VSFQSTCADLVEHAWLQPCHAVELYFQLSLDKVALGPHLHEGDTQLVPPPPRFGSPNSSARLPSSSGYSGLSSGLTCRRELHVFPARAFITRHSPSPSPGQSGRMDSFVLDVVPRPLFLTAHQWQPGSHVDISVAVRSTRNQQLTAPHHDRISPPLQALI
jgi:hypothetical protein